MIRPPLHLFGRRGLSSTNVMPHCGRSCRRPRPDPCLTEMLKCGFSWWILSSVTHRGADRFVDSILPERPLPRGTHDRPFSLRPAHRDPQPGTIAGHRRHDHRDPCGRHRHGDRHVHHRADGDRPAPPGPEPAAAHRASRLRRQHRAVAANATTERRFSREARTLRDVAGVGVLQIASPNIIGDVTYSLRSAAVSGNFFEMLGARPALGRLIRSADDAKGCGTPSCSAIARGERSSAGTRRCWVSTSVTRGTRTTASGTTSSSAWLRRASISRPVSTIGTRTKATRVPRLPAPASRWTPGAGATAGAARAEWLAFRQRAYEQTLTSAHMSGRFHVTRAESVSSRR